MPTPNNAFETIATDELVTATGGLYAAIGAHPLLSLTNNLTQTLAAQQQNQQNQNTQLMTMGMLALALRNRY
jgi:hypothetical protein